MNATGEAQVLVVAKAPVPGEAKTRLGAVVGMDRAADLAAAALLDTINACATAFPGNCHLALAGDLGGAARATEIRQALRGWSVFAQEGRSFAGRLVHAHHSLDTPAGSTVVQIGMDTPQVGADLLRAVAGAATDKRSAVLGPATDGGWWCLALRDPDAAGALVDVPMSTSTTAAATAAALVGYGLTVRGAPTLTDVDTSEDADAVSRIAPQTRFARAWTTAGRPAGKGA